ncbi:hypothetical protein RHOFW510R12_14800 [Rhodanobacter sp. FW510-R12]|uniref:hypothetical protein n=1 Tax=Rhodanobacter TaxID=75309 RepID=UPI00042A0681|nr:MULTISPECIES: hypothetical protein [Rhodanobacter]UJJ53396.1 hypothetical protein LRK53_10340 [Rhodanobacter thiooxydans]
MEYRDFKFADETTATNLRFLAHCSGQEPYGDHRALDSFLVGVIQTHEMLPETLKRLIPISWCYTNGTHWNMSPERQQELWHRITADLRTGIERVEAEGPSIDSSALADRKETKGERILALVKELKEKGEDEHLVKRLAFEGAGSEVALDAKALQKLFAKKRVPDMAQYNAEIARLVDHIERIAKRLHGLG